MWYKKSQISILLYLAFSEGVLIHGEIYMIYEIESLKI